MRLKRFEQINENLNEDTFTSELNGISEIDIYQSIDDEFNNTNPDIEVDMDNLKASIIWKERIEYRRSGIEDLNVDIYHITLSVDYLVYDYTNGDEDVEPKESFKVYEINNDNADIEVEFEDGKSIPLYPNSIQIEKGNEKQFNVVVKF